MRRETMTRSGACVSGGVDVGGVGVCLQPGTGPNRRQTAFNGRRQTVTRATWPVGVGSRLFIYGGANRHRLQLATQRHPSPQLDMFFPRRTAWGGTGTYASWHYMQKAIDMRNLIREEDGQAVMKAWRRQATSRAWRGALCNRTENGNSGAHQIACMFATTPPASINLPPLCGVAQA